MGVILDILILFIFLLFVLKNYRKQQLRCALETISFVLAAGFSVPIATMLSDLCYSKMFRGALAHNLEPVLSDTAKLSGNFSNYDRVMEKMPSVVRFASESYQINTDANIAEVERLVTGNTTVAGVQIVDIVAQPVIEGVFRGTFCAVFFTGLQYLITAIGAMVENALYTPDRATQNTVLCGVFGCFKGLIVITVIVTTLQLILPSLPTLPLLNTETLGNSFLFRLFYHQNVLMLFMGKGIYPMSF